MTKKLLFVTTILLALSMAAFAADVTGKWTFEQQGDGSWTIQNRYNQQYLNTDVPNAVGDGERVVTSKTPQLWGVEWDDQYRGYR